MSKCSFSLVNFVLISYCVTFIDILFNVEFDGVGPLRIEHWKMKIKRYHKGVEGNLFNFLHFYNKLIHFIDHLTILKKENGVFAYWNIKGGHTLGVFKDLMVARYIFFFSFFGGNLYKNTNYSNCIFVKQTNLNNYNNTIIIKISSLVIDNKFE